MNNTEPRPTDPVRECPRCGQDHDDLEMLPFPNPPMLNGRLVEFWQLCPVANAPILKLRRM
jgi:hypothetical protein